MADYKERLKLFDAALARDKLDLTELQRLSKSGIPEGSGRRATFWRILLNYLPPKRAQWSEYLAKQRRTYQQFLDEMVFVSHSESPTPDHPLNPNPCSLWQSFFKDNEVLLQIDKDVRRLCPDISFFSQPTTAPNPKIAEDMYDRLHVRVQQTRLQSQSLQRVGIGMNKLSLSKRKAAENYSPLEDGNEAHWEVVERILFIYAKLNPGQGYVQGMNEIIGPIYYVFASDPREEWRAHAEADCFFCFTNLMSDIRDFFIKTLDKTESGITGIMERFMDTLKARDFQTHARLQEQDLKPQFFAFRWLTLMLSQEFALPDVLRIWDSLLSDETRCDLLIEVCVAMIMLVREKVMVQEFGENMKLLQNYPYTDVGIILTAATRALDGKGS